MMRSFNLEAEGNFDSDIFTGTATYVNFSDSLTNPKGFVLEVETGLGFKFDVQGFKNIDLYGIQMNMYFQTNPPSNENAIVEDYMIRCNVNGTAPLIGGFVGSPVTAPFQLTTNLNKFFLTKYTSKIDFCTPVKSAKSFAFEKIFVQGTIPQNGSIIQLKYHINAVMYYKFEGE